MIKYIICEDGDDEFHPNAFNVSGHSSPTLGIIKKSFPVPGDYHFRFLTTLGHSKVWIDILDNTASVPFHDGSIFMKVSRLGKHNQSCKLSNISSDITNNISYQSTTTKTSVINSSGSTTKSDKLLSFESEDENDSPRQLVQSKSLNDTSDLLGIDSPSPDVTSVKQQQPPIDLFGLDTLQQTGNLLTKPMQTGNFSSMPPRGMPKNNSFDAFSNLQQFPPRGPQYTKQGKKL